MSGHISPRPNLFKRSSRWIKHLTILRWADQRGRCYYCLRQTWIERVHSREQAIKEFGIALNLLNDLKATAEHLWRWRLGGRSYPSNIVMACWRCNTDRGERDVLDHVKAQRAGRATGADDPHAGAVEGHLSHLAKVFETRRAA